METKQLHKDPLPPEIFANVLESDLQYVETLAVQPILMDPEGGDKYINDPKTETLHDPLLGELNIVISEIMTVFEEKRELKVAVELFSVVKTIPIFRRGTDCITTLIRNEVFEIHLGAGTAAVLAILEENVGADSNRSLPCNVTLKDPLQGEFIPDMEEGANISRLKVKQEERDIIDAKEDVIAIPRCVEQQLPTEIA